MSLLAIEGSVSFPVEAKDTIFFINSDHRLLERGISGFSIMINPYNRESYTGRS